jgi:hypothetical protein
MRGRTAHERFAVAVLDDAHRQHPTDRDVLMALVSIARDTGHFATALRHARSWPLLIPRIPGCAR